LTNEPVKLGIVGLGRWAKVLTRAALKSDKLVIVSAYTRSEEKRRMYEDEFSIPAVPDLDSLLGNPEIKGVILTVPNEAHLPCAELAAKAGKHIYTEKPIANTLENGLRLEALQNKHNVIVEVGHSARLLKGTVLMKQAIDRGELGTIAFMEANFSNERALELTPDTWRWYRDKAPGGPLSQLAIHQFNALHYLGGEISEVSSVASKLSPVGAEVDDQSMTVLKFRNGALGYVGSSWTSPGIYAIRVFGQKALMHYEVDFSTWDNPSELHKSSSLYIQRGKNGFGLREEIQLPEGDMFLEELDLFAEACLTGRLDNLSAYDGNVAIAVVNAALKSVENKGILIRLDDVVQEARNKILS